MPRPPADLPWHFIGVQAVEARAFADVPDNQPFETVKQLYPALIAQQPWLGSRIPSDAEFLDVGTIADYFETVDVVAEREGRALDRGSNITIDPRRGRSSIRSSGTVCGWRAAPS